MDCAICLNENTTHFVLCCGHSFHPDCLKQWYLKGDIGNTCPICRTTICFKGMYKQKAEWTEEREETRYESSWKTQLTELFEAFDEVYEDIRTDDDDEVWNLTSEDLMDSLSIWYPSIISG